MKPNKQIEWCALLAWAVKFTYGNVNFENCLEFLGYAVYPNKPFKASEFRTAAMITSYAINGEE